MIDAKLARWSALLLLLAGLTLAFGLIVPASLVVADGPVMLTRGSDVWQTTFYRLPFLDRALLLGILSLPEIAWLYVVVQIAVLAHHYRAGSVFDRRNSETFARIGKALAVMAVLSAAALPLAAWMLYVRGDCPWLADISVLGALEPDLLLAGAFLFVVGKVMQRGAELQEEEILTI